MFLNTLQFSLRCLSRPSVGVQQLKTVPKRNATGWLHRTPKAVVNEEIVLENAEEASEPKPRKHVAVFPDREPMKPKIRHIRPKKAPPPVKSDNLYNDNGTLNIHKYSTDDRTLASLVCRLKSRKLREKNNQMILEGLRLMEDAIKSNIHPEIVLFSRTADVEKLSLPPKGVKLYKVPYATLQLWSSFTTSPGIMGIFKSPASFEKEPTKNSLPLTIICDNVRDPGNLGTIIRAAAGVGCERLILMKGCVDVWEQKVLRSAAGAHFRISISKSAEWSDIDSLISQSANVYIADNKTTSGINPESEVNDAEVTSGADEESKDGKDRETTETEVEESSKNPKVANLVTIQELTSRIPVVPYYAVDYATNESVLIVGGETEGLSYESIQLVNERNGVRVNIPLTNEVESLNTGMALGIVAFEVKRQFALRKPVV